MLRKITWREQEYVVGLHLTKSESKRKKKILEKADAYDAVQYGLLESDEGYMVALLSESVDGFNEDMMNLPSAAFILSQQLALMSMERSYICIESIPTTGNLDAPGALEELRESKTPKLYWLTCVRGGIPATNGDLVLPYDSVMSNVKEFMGQVQMFGEEEKLPDYILVGSGLADFEELEPSEQYDFDVLEKVDISDYSAKEVKDVTLRHMPVVSKKPLYAAAAAAVLGSALYFGWGFYTGYIEDKRADQMLLVNKQKALESLRGMREQHFSSPYPGAFLQRVFSQLALQPIAAGHWKVIVIDCNTTECKLNWLGGSRAHPDQLSERIEQVEFDPRPADAREGFTATSRVSLAGIRNEKRDLENYGSQADFQVLCQTLGQIVEECTSEPPANVDFQHRNLLDAALLYGTGRWKIVAGRMIEQQLAAVLDVTRWSYVDRVVMTFKPGYDMQIVVEGYYIAETI